MLQFTSIYKGAAYPNNLVYILKMLTFFLLQNNNPLPVGLHTVTVDADSLHPQIHDSLQEYNCTITQSSHGRLSFSSSLMLRVAAVMKGMCMRIMKMRVKYWDIGFFYCPIQR